MQCEQCGATGEGAFCSRCGARLGATTDKDPSDAFWVDGDVTTSSRAPSTSVWRRQDTGGPHSPPPSPPPGGYGGYPPPSRGTSWPVAVGAAALAALLVLGIGGGALWWLTSDRDDSAATETVAPSSTGTATEPTTSEPTTTTVTSTTTSTSDTPDSDTPDSDTADASAEGQLADLRDESLGRLATDGRWAVTLSAKQDGTRDERQVTSGGSHVFRLPDILELHEVYDSVYASTASVYLLKAEDLGSTSTGTDSDRIWMTVVDPGGLTSREDAEQWCQNEFSWLSGDDLDNACYPRRLESP